MCALSATDAPTTLVIRHVPVPLTCGVFDATIITDPSLLEEELLTTHVTVVSNAEGKVSTEVARCDVCNVQALWGLRAGARRLLG